MTRASLGELLCFLHAAAAQATDSLLRFPVRSESCPCDLHTQSIGGNKMPANVVGPNQHSWCIYVTWGHAMAAEVAGTERYTNPDRCGAADSRWQWMAPT